MNYETQKVPEELRPCMDEIAAVIKKHDVAAVIVLHKPSVSTYYVRIDPSYSALSLEQDSKGRQGFRLRLKASDVGKEKARQIATDTANMSRLLCDTTMKISVDLMDMADVVDEKLGAEHSKLNEI